MGPNTNRMTSVLLDLLAGGGGGGDVFDGGTAAPKELKPAPHGSAAARTEATSKAVTAAVRLAIATVQA